MLRIDHLISLVSEAAEGKFNFEEGAIGSNGYGFVFKRFDYESLSSFVIGDGSSKLCSIGAFRDIEKIIEEYPKTIPHIDRKADLHFAGRIKTLISRVEFGGFESLYHVWMFVKTPQNKYFPATFYYKQSNTSVGAWSSDYRTFLFAEEKKLPQKFESIINFSPFNFSKTELEEFIEALKFSLNMVPISDFEGIYKHDMGRELIGIRSGKPFIKKLKPDERKEVKTWSYSIEGNSEASSLTCDFIEIMNSYLTSTEIEKYPRETPRYLWKTLIERASDHLITHVYKQNSRLAFLVLGSFLMFYKSKMTKELKQVILGYSDWEHEKDQLQNARDRKERKKFLDDFREKIKNYDGSKVIKLPLYTVTRVINEKREKGDTTPIWRKNIDYSINS